MIENGSSLTTLKKAGAALIEYPRFKKLHREILQCQQISKLLNEPQCMSLEGVTGAGKTTLVRTYADSFERIVTGEGLGIPVFYVEVPSPVTIRDLAQEALRQLGDPAYDKGTRAALTTRLVEFIKDCGVELVILDDFQHLIDSETDHILSQVSDWLKVLIKKTKVPFLVVGIEGRVEIILKANPQLSRLFAAREKLEPFSWNLAQEGTIQDFSRFVYYAEQATGKRLTSDLPRQELLYRLHYATNGVVGNLMNLMLNTAFLAAEQGKPSLDLDLLSLAFRKRLAEHLQGKVDPFAEVIGTSFVPPTPAASSASADKGKNSDKKRRSPVAAVLTTR